MCITLSMTLLHVVQVFTDIDLVRKVLNHKEFVLVNSPDEASILWLYDHFKGFE